MADAPLPANTKYDGYDLAPVLLNGGDSPRKEMFYYHGTRIFAARKGDYKLYFYKNNPLGYPERMEKLDTLRLFNIAHDPSERYDVFEQHPDVIKQIIALVAQHSATVDPAPSQLDKRIDR
jgi:hypothetical protein